MAQVIDGFWIDKIGKKTHPDLIRADVKLKDELVEDILDKVIAKQQELKEFKTDIIGSVDGFFDLLLQEYNVDAKAGSKKGNITLENFNGTKKVVVAVNYKISFDEKLSIAKQKLDEYLHEVTKDSDPEIQTLITQAFEVDKKGQVNGAKISALRSYDIKNPKWVEAMSIIDEAREVVGSKRYIRFYSRNETTDPYKQVSIDFSSL